MSPSVLPSLLRAGLLCCGLWSGAAPAADPPPVDHARIAEERARIQALRDRLEAGFAAEESGCRERFAVTACVDDVRMRRREALIGPRARALELADLERLQRAQARRLAVRDKQRRAAERPAPAASEAAPRVVRAVPPPASAASSAHVHSPAASAEAARRAEAAKERQVKINATQQRIEARQAERARSGKAAAPLPVPAASAAR